MLITGLEGARCTPDRAGARVIDMPGADFLTWLGNATTAPSLECADLDAKLAGDGFVLAQYRPGATSKLYEDLDPGSSTDLLCYDVDKMPLADVPAALELWRQVDAVAYTTWKHTPEAPRLRLLVRLSRPVPNATESEFRAVYAAAAQVLGVPADPSASARANLYFMPQHKPGANGTVGRERFLGQALDTDRLLEFARANGLGADSKALVRVGGDAQVSVFAGVASKPSVPELRGLVKKLSASQFDRRQGVARSLAAILRGERFAEEGERHTVTLAVAWEVVKSFPSLDADWFADTHLSGSWALMWPEGVGGALKDWHSAVAGAEQKIEAGAAAALRDRSDYGPSAPEPLTGEELELAARSSEALVCAHRNAFYVYSPRECSYVGPLTGTGLHAACRTHLLGVPGFKYEESKMGGAPSLVPGARLVERYGSALDAVQYHAAAPALAYEPAARTIHIAAYRWNAWDATHHPIADELLRALAGRSYAKVEAYLSQFRNLQQPLCALVLAGERGTWKSQLPKILSRFWGPRDVGTPCNAAQVLNKFSDPLLKNPVVRSDEAPALSEAGKPIPERYRMSISDTVHNVEPKGTGVVTLHSALRHILAVNDVDRVFGSEVDNASTQATLERYLVLEIDKATMEAFELRWAGTAEVQDLREGRLLLEHVMWIEQNTSHVSEGRLFVAPDTRIGLIRNARFADETLTLALSIALAALFAEDQMSVPGQPGRVPLLRDEKGVLRLSPEKIAALWIDHKLTRGSGLKRPTSQRIGQLLTKAGFKTNKNERATNNRWRAWELSESLLEEFVEQLDGAYSWAEVQDQLNTCSAVPYRRRMGGQL